MGWFCLKMNHQMHSEVSEDLDVDFGNPVRSVDNYMTVDNDHRGFRVARLREANDQQPLVFVQISVSQPISIFLRRLPCSCNQTSSSKMLKLNGIGYFAKECGLSYTRDAGKGDDSLFHTSNTKLERATRSVSRSCRNS